VRQVGGAFVALFGVAVVVLNRRFGRASVDTGRSFFGRPMAEGSRQRRFARAYGRGMAIAVGSLLAVGGTAIALGLW